MVKLTMLNSMASKNFEESLDVQKSWGIEVLDLKDHIFGKAIAELTLEEAAQAARLIDERGLRVYCLSTQIFEHGLGLGEQAYGELHLQAVERIVGIAGLLKPTYIRLLPARLKEHREWVGRSDAFIERECPWLIGLYQTAIDRLSAAGFQTVIENETDSLLASPEEIIDFFAKLDRPGQVYFTYDVQNLWQMGTYPSLDVYRRLKPMMNFFHVKGGIEDPETRGLQWKSSIEDATWPVEELTRQVVRDGISPVICLNPSHGAAKPDYDYSDVFRKDLEYMKSLVARFGA